MQGKITLITPPDLFENENISLLFMHLGDVDQEAVSKWFASSSVDQNVNIYFYDHDVNVPWLLHAVNRADYKFVNLDNLNYATIALSGYFLGKSNTYWKTENEGTAAVYHYINQNRITKIESFLEKVFYGKK